MSLGRKQALKRLHGLAKRVREHLEYLANEPAAQAVSHWRQEIRGWLEQMEGVLPHVGKKTARDWQRYIAEWHQAVGE